MNLPRQINWSFFRQRQIGSGTHADGLTSGHQNEAVVVQQSRVDGLLLIVSELLQSEEVVELLLHVLGNQKHDSFVLLKISPILLEICPNITSQEHDTCEKREFRCVAQERGKEFLISEIASNP